MIEVNELADFIREHGLKIVIGMFLLMIYFILSFMGVAS